MPTRLHARNWELRSCRTRSKGRFEYRRILASDGGSVDVVHALIISFVTTSTSGLDLIRAMRPGRAVGSAVLTTEA